MKTRLTSYTFSASGKTVTSASFSDVTLAGIQLIVNATDNIIIYNFADPSLGGTLATDTLTLDYDTTSMSDTDELMILVEDGTTTQPVSASSLPLPTGASTSAKQDTIIGHLDGVETTLTAIDGRVDGVESLLTTIDADTSNLSTKIDTLAGAVAGTEMQVDVLSSALPTGASTSANQSTIITALQLIDDTVFTDDGTFTPATSKVNAVGYFADETSTDSVDEGDVGAPRMTLNRQQIVTIRPNANGEGLDIFRTLDADETEEAVKASAGKIYGWYMYNDGASEVYVKFYNDTVANVAVGTTTPAMTIPIPAGSGTNVEFTNGIPFTTAITIAATTGVADSDTTAPAANQVVANIFYK